LQQRFSCVTAKTYSGESESQAGKRSAWLTSAI